MNNIHCALEATPWPDCVELVHKCLPQGCSSLCSYLVTNQQKLGPQQAEQLHAALLIFRDMLHRSASIDSATSKFVSRGPCQV